MFTKKSIVWPYAPTGIKPKVPQANPRIILQYVEKPTFLCR